MNNLPSIRQTILQKPVRGIYPEEIIKIKTGIDIWVEESKKLKTSKNTEFISYRDKLLIDFLYHTGIRISDVVGRPYTKYRKDGTIIFPWEGIKFSDINWQKGILRFVIHKRSRKNLFIHEIVLDKSMLYDLMQYKQRYTFEDNDIMFKMTLQNFDKSLKKYSKYVGMEYLSAHKYRHGMAIKDLEEEKPDFLTAFRLGHSSVDVTNSTYRRMNTDYERKMRGY